MGMEDPLVAEVHNDEQRDTHVGNQDVGPIEFDKGIYVLSGNDQDAEDEGKNWAKWEETSMVTKLIQRVTLLNEAAAEPVVGDGNPEPFHKAAQTGGRDQVVIDVGTNELECPECETEDGHC